MQQIHSVLVCRWYVCVLKLYEFAGLLQVFSRSFLCFFTRYELGLHAMVAVTSSPAPGSILYRITIAML